MTRFQSGSIRDEEIKAKEERRAKWQAILKLLTSHGPGWITVPPRGEGLRGDDNAK